MGSVIGFLVSLPANINRREFLAALQAKVPHVIQETNDFLTIEMPCGVRVSWRSPEDVPLEDVPCPCRQSGHWLIKWEIRDSLLSMPVDIRYN